MNLKPRKPSTDPSLRSLLQKAARRGFEEVVSATARRLLSIGDATWLRSRAVVVTFEECWPLAAQLAISRDPDSKVGALRAVTQSTKQKDAAGLGALAFAFSEGDRTTLQAVPDEWYVRMVSEALARPAAFFEWATKRAGEDSAVSIVAASQQYLPAATWGWDKACIIAGALLAVTSPVPQCSTAPSPSGLFPYWVALDKHTPDGKEILQEVATRLAVPYRHLIWSGFYFESASVNLLASSPWFEAERRWRFSRTGLTVDEAAELWERVRAPVAESLSERANALRDSIERNPGPIQHSLL